MDDPTSATLGGRTYTLAPQRTGRILRKLRVIQKAFGDTSKPEEITGALHEALKVFVPDLDPEWKLAGYPSAEDYAEKTRHDEAVAEARREYVEQLREIFTEHGAATAADLPPEVLADLPEFEEPEQDWVDPWRDDADQSPTIPEIADTIEAIYAVNGGRRLEKLLGQVIDPAMLRAITRSMYLDWVSTRSRNSRPPSGASASTTSGTTSRTTLAATNGEAPLEGKATETTTDPIPVTD